jgi:LuxR family maltose regulon positive regulatory protein
VAGAAATLAEAERAARQHGFALVMPDIVAARVVTLLRQGDVAVAARLARELDLPLSRARVHLAEGNASAALALLEPFRRLMDDRAWADVLLESMVPQSLAAHAQGEKARARWTSRAAGDFIPVHLR